MPKTRHTKPHWVQTEMAWELRFGIFRRFALGDNIKQVAAWLERKGQPRDRGTVGKVREELRDLPPEIAPDLDDLTRGFWLYIRKVDGLPTKTPVTDVADSAPKAGRNAQESHLARVIELAAALRDRIVNPHLEWSPSDGASIWDLGGQNLRLTPTTWAYVVTPYLEEEALWGPAFPSVRAHLAASPFWERHASLHEGARQIGKLLEDSATKLSSSDPGFARSWEEVQAGLDWHTIPMNVPGADEPPNELAKLPYESAYASRVIKAASQHAPVLRARYRDLERTLQDLWNNLDPDLVGQLMQGTTCDRCSPA